MIKRWARKWGAMAAMALALSATSAQSADIAAIRPIGFSAHGRIFAFEEYGIQDGSGFPYSNIFAIDTEKDAYLDGTPIRVRLDDDGASLGKARAEAATAASGLLGSFALEDHPGNFVAFNPISEVNAQSHTLRYLVHPADPAVGGAYGLRLEEIAEPAPPQCKDMVAQIRSFRLILTAREGKPANEKLYQDKAIPKSRNCPSGYRLGGVMTHAPTTGGKTIHMALVMVLSIGFEGRDGRWIAVPLRP
ncbi:DUF2259 domain-containing protein [Rhizobium sp. RU36D]|uniref:DUF2259 domain-containing protein n=1 Tax=Rhizobium sp. RU36D TaxID=1907415 RepID=UPI0009D86B52|nr:DUF2259 domain-containing protein [Rhizobium sp. RU36D]SMC81651.1 Predicted secreted protein [Rhizobium sp. RU36D]